MQAPSPSSDPDEYPDRQRSDEGDPSLEDRLKKYELPERPNIFWPLLAFVAAFLTAALYSLSAWVAAGIGTAVFVIVLIGTSLKKTMDRRPRCPVCRAVVSASAERCMNCGNDLGEGR